MKKLFTIFTAMIITSVLNLCAQSIYVDASNNTGIEDGSEQHPYNTIKEGVAAAMAGSTVMIKAGTYYPDESWSGYNNVLYLKAGVSLEGEGRENTLIEGIIVDQEESNLSIGLEYLYFLEFRFNRETRKGPFDEPNIIRNCGTGLIVIAHGSGIPVNDTTPGPIYGFTIENNDLGTDGNINFQQGSGVAENRILNNSFGTISIKSGAGFTYLIDNNDVEYGIADMSGTCTTTISNNRIYNGAIIDNSGSNLYGVEDEIIENNTINCNEDSPFLEDEYLKAGIIANPRSVTIRNNTITCTGNVSGIRASSGAPFHVENNTITVDEVLFPVEDPEEGIIGLLNKSGWGYVTGNIIYGGQIGYYSKAGTEVFADNEIKKSYTGFFSAGAEEVHHNTIEQCYGDGMILHGLRGPIYNNIIKDNSGSGIRVTRPNIDLGGGEDNCPGGNVIQGNGNYDLYIETSSEQYPVLFARNNVWDHTDPNEIMQFDIRDGNDSTGLNMADIVPVAYEGIYDRPADLDFSVFLNPARNIISLQSTVFSRQSVTVEVFDLNGRKLLEKQIPAGSDEVKINVSSLQNGLYLCRIRTDNKSVTKKLIIQK